MLASKPLSTLFSRQQHVRKRSEPLTSGAARAVAAASVRCCSSPNSPDDKAKAKKTKRPKQQVINVSGGVHIHLVSVNEQQAAKSVPPAAAAAAPEHLIVASEWLSDSNHLDALVRTIQQARLQQQQQQEVVEVEQCAPRPAATGQILQGEQEEGERPTGDGAEQSLRPRSDEARIGWGAADQQLGEERAALSCIGLPAASLHPTVQQQAVGAAEAQEAVAAQAGAKEQAQRKQAASRRPASMHGGVEGEEGGSYIKPVWWFRDRKFNTVRQLGSRFPGGPRFCLLENCKVHNVVYQGAEHNNSEMARRLMAKAGNPNR